MSADQSVETLLHKLKFHELIIEKLLSFPCSSTSSKMNLLERKILLLEEMVLEIPNDGEGYHWDLFVEWRDTVVQLWRRLFLMAGGENLTDGGKQLDGASIATMATVATSTTGQARTPNKPSSSASSFGGGGDNRTPSRGRGGPIRIGQTKQTYRSLNFRRSVEPARTRVDAEERSVAPKPDVQQVKDELRVQLEDAFSKLAAVEELSDLEAMQALLTLIAKAVKQLSPFNSDVGLQADILAYALPKVPLHVVERFNDRAEEPESKTMRLLKKCLIDELKAYYAELKESLKAAAADASVNDEGGDDGEEVTSEKTCYYCKAAGHLSFQCPQALQMICFKCFKQGHKAVHCGPRCYKCNRMGHYKKHCKN